jgi:hypothetical protein
MGLFGTSKTKITPHEFVKNQLDNIFSPEFIRKEKECFSNISSEINVFKNATVEKYIIERQNVIYNLFQLAWDRTVPYAIFIEYSSIMLNDPRVKHVNSGVYDRCLSRAQDAGMDTFGFISRLFLAQIIPSHTDINATDYDKLFVTFGTDFTNCFIHYESLIKKHKFVT